MDEKVKKRRSKMNEVNLEIHPGKGCVWGTL